ncbi:MAG: DUF3293 domain-containing protein [Nitrosomonadaceae bacterium]|nr:DUF3293 domain-containing protein [Nitrosomonadaceae bacterium]
MPTIRAYRETEYRVHGKTPACLKVGSQCPELAAIHQAHRTDCSLFITAYNPFGKCLDEATNIVRQEDLANELKQRSLIFIDGIGQHPSKEWPGEPSYLVFGLKLEAAKTLGVKYEQNAIIWTGSDAVPQLILLR